MRRTGFTRIAAAVALMLATGTGLVVTRPASAAGQDQGSGGTEAVNCRKTFASGSGTSHFVWCFSDTGNIVMLEGPGTQEHIRVGTFLEGYAVCIGGSTEGFDNGNSGAGFGGPSYPNATTVVRNTPNTKLTQVYTQTVGDKIARVKMTVTNLTAAPLAAVRLSRFVDLDIDGSPAGDRWDKSAASLWAAETNAVTMSARSGIASATTASFVETFGDVLNDTGCDATTPLTTPYAGDASGRINISIGSLAAHASATVTFNYTQL